ncbi:hypothetical protein [Actinoplanes auranticolor]|uniref:Uncharacterized protein n=1 Tax=Actinoplanes auranticolor TaxID=47988 RepID=A0A919VJM4_9ACTN|nr:hypothetical protein [Actinoplanes auranticolor]GIM68479.1 hypothetical protein Aau02nite_31830 [Actinoplanes auranticolor]
MSYDLAVWDGDRPADDLAAAAEFKQLYDRYVGSPDRVEPTARIAAYVRALLDRYPDIGTDAGEDSPWSTGPLLNEARGPLVYFPMVWRRSEEVSAWAAGLAGEHGLNCYDPQDNRLRTPAGAAWRFELTSTRGRALRDPDGELVRRELVRLSADNHYAVLKRVDGWYIQAAYGTWAGTRPGWYVLERRDGGPEKHFRAEVVNVDEVVRAFVAFLEDDPTIAVRFPWHPYVV